MVWFRSSQPGNLYTSNEKGLGSVEGKQTDSDWLRGQLHHLTEEQESRLEEFKSICETEGYYMPRKGGSAETLDNTLFL